MEEARGAQASLASWSFPGRFAHFSYFGAASQPHRAGSEECRRSSNGGGGGQLDVDLDGLDGYLGQRYPGALVFEIHNSEEPQPMPGIEPGKPVQEYEVGTVGPIFERPLERFARIIETGIRDGLRPTAKRLCMIPGGRGSVRAGLRHGSP
jgi:hypothetical protein